MVRNWDTVREILLALEAVKTPNGNLRHDQVPGIDPQDVAYHMRLLKEAGLIEALIKDSKSGNNQISIALADRLTWRGHELLDTIRQKTVWEKVKTFGKEKIGPLTFEAVMEIGKAVVKDALTGSSG
jgi:DNA-binding transcriptional ArsR family regulator